MLKLSKENAKNNIFTTFIGLGIDFNTNLVRNSIVSYFPLDFSFGFHSRKQLFLSTI